jgi:hypothetical protein
VLIVLAVINGVAVAIGTDMDGSKTSSQPEPSSSRSWRSRPTH